MGGGWTWSGYVIVCTVWICLCLHPASAVCKTAKDKLSVCIPAEGSRLDLHCSVSSRTLHIETVQYYITNSSTCPVNDMQGGIRICLSDLDLTEYVREKCEGRGSCDPDLIRKESSTCGGITPRHHYITVLYTCRQEKIKDINVCDNSEISGSSLRLQGGSPPTSSPTIVSNCSCQLVISREVSIQISLESIQPHRDSCRHWIRLTPANARFRPKKMCQEDSSDRVSSCDGNNTVHTISYMSNMSGLEGNFSVVLDSPADMEMSLRCTGSTELVTTATPPIGVVLVAAPVAGILTLILIIILIVLIVRYHRKRHATDLTPHPPRPSPAHGRLSRRRPPPAPPAYENPQPDDPSLPPSNGTVRSTVPQSEDSGVYANDGGSTVTVHGPPSISQMSLAGRYESLNHKPPAEHIYGDASHMYCTKIPAIRR